MFRRRLALAAIVLFAFTSAPSYAQSESQQNERAKRIEARLKDEELKFSLCGNEKNQEQIALLNLHLEQARSAYAMNLALNAEGITPGRTVSASQEIYEQTQVKLAGKCKRVQEALKVIQRERALAVAMAQEYRRDLAESGELPM